MDEIKTVIDNTKDWYNLLDTTIKIGLGAFIAGTFTYITNKSNHKHEEKKLQYELRRNLLIETNELSSKYFSSFIYLFEKIENNKEEYEKALMLKRKNYFKIDFNLSLLNLHSCRKYINSCEQLSEKIIKELKIEENSDKVSIVKLMMEKENFFQELEKYFKNLE
ncbi:hypothetical protein [Arcobacter sp.]|uniref:hypothetical protein n=1 Tax=Arcobacter sp. TaxID=1872629 RepID=UPI003D0FEC3C